MQKATSEQTLRALMNRTLTEAFMARQNGELELAQNQYAAARGVYAAARELGLTDSRTWTGLSNALTIYTRSLAEQIARRGEMAA
jgi:hypothetical protein